MTEFTAKLQQIICGITWPNSLQSSSWSVRWRDRIHFKAPPDLYDNMTEFTSKLLLICTMTWPSSLQIPTVSKTVTFSNSITNGSPTSDSPGELGAECTHRGRWRPLCEEGCVSCDAIRSPHSCHAPRSVPERCEDRAATWSSSYIEE